MKKRRPQPSPVEVLFRRSREGRAGLLADAMRAMERNGEQKKTGLENEAAFHKKPTQLIFERSEQANHDRREPIQSLTDPAHSHSRRSDGVGVRDACELARCVPGRMRGPE
jgi:hypothetical protein